MSDKNWIVIEYTFLVMLTILTVLSWFKTGFYGGIPISCVLYLMYSVRPSTVIVSDKPKV